MAAELDITNVRREGDTFTVNMEFQPGKNLPRQELVAVVQAKNHADAIKAARNQIEELIPQLKQALDDLGVDGKMIGAIAASGGSGEQDAQVAAAGAAAVKPSSAK